MTRENELLRKILRGENEYWEELIGMYYEDIYRYCIYHAHIGRHFIQKCTELSPVTIIRKIPYHLQKCLLYCVLCQIPVWCMIDTVSVNVGRRKSRRIPSIWKRGMPGRRTISGFWSGSGLCQRSFGRLSI